VKELQDIVRRLTSSDGPWALATLVDVAGSSYRRAGARALLKTEGPGRIRLGSISGGCLEDDIWIRAHQVLSDDTPQVAVYDTTSENDLVWGVGLGCHGIVTVLIEPLPSAPGWAAAAAAALAGGEPCDLITVWDATVGPLGTRAESGTVPERGPHRGIYRERIAPPPRLWIFGAGDDARPLARLAGELGWTVAVADPRPAYATRERFPEAAEILARPVDSLVSQVAGALRPGDSNRGGRHHPVLAVIMTHHYMYDKPLLAGLIALPLLYLGLLGPRKRAERLLEEIGLPDAAARLHAPVGLDLGAEGAEEVALSILAEMRATLAGRDARPLRDRRQPIHATDP
jgi:xanthine/CO dehydrogenase XdhC/CoxF family maturation factor